MSKYIDADLLIRKIKGQIRLENLNFAALGGGGQTFCINTLEWVLEIIDSLQQEQQMPDSTQLIVEWEREKAVLEQRDFRGDAERMAYNAFLDGFVKGIGYGRTK